MRDFCEPDTTTSGSDATDAEEQGVVLIDTTLTDGKAAGTGLVIDADGLVLTNYHVVEGSTEVQVTIASTGVQYVGTVVGHDQEADVALLQLTDASGLDTVKLMRIDPRISHTVVVGSAKRGRFCLMETVHGQVWSMSGANRAQATFSRGSCPSRA